jgi:hypothetical protein
LTGQTAHNAVIESHNVYSATGGSGANCVYSVALGLNDPIKLSFTVAGNPAGDVAIFYRINNTTGACYYWDFSWTSGFFNFYYVDTSGSYHKLFAQAMPTLTADDYSIEIYPFYGAHSCYLINQTTGEYCAPSGVFQVDKIGFVELGHAALMTGGLAGFAVSTASGDVNAIRVTSISGGPHIYIPTDLAAVWVTDRFVQLYVRSQQGGVSPISYDLKRQTGGSGAFTTIGTITPDVDYYDNTVSPGTVYAYEVVTTDSASTPVVTTSNRVSVTTLATRTITPYTLGSGSLSSVVTGDKWLDTSSVPMQIFHHQVWWDQWYGQYFLTADTSSTDHTGASVGIWASTDLMNWTPQGAVISGLNVHGTTYNFISCLGVLRHPTNGFYYAFFQANQGVVASYYIFRGLTPTTAGANYIAGPIQPPLVNDGGGTHIDESYWYLDPATSLPWLFYSLNGPTSESTYQSSYAVQINAGWTDFKTTASLVSPLDGNSQVPAPFRVDRMLYVGSSYATVYYWNPNMILVGTDPTNTGNTGSPINNQWYTIPGATVFPSAAQTCPAPAGAAASDGYISSGFGGTLDSGYKTDFVGYGGGTARGVDPLNSYASQVFSVFRKSSGERIWCAIRWVAAGNDAANCWFPITFDSNKQPTIPFVQSFVP